VCDFWVALPGAKNVSNFWVALPECLKLMSFATDAQIDRNILSKNQTFFQIIKHS